MNESSPLNSTPHGDRDLKPEESVVEEGIVAANDSLWTIDVDRGAPTRITFEAENSRPVWSR